MASDARTALDKQYSDAKAAGKDLTFLPSQKDGVPVDFSQFDSRSLSAVALNQGNQFSAQEVFAAKQAISQRSNSTVLAGLQSSSNDPMSFAKNLISAYSSMSPEERKAAGWSDQLYAAAVASYNTASQIANIFGDSTSSDGSSGSGSNTALSFLDYMNTTTARATAAIACPSPISSHSGS